MPENDDQETNVPGISKNCESEGEPETKSPNAHPETSIPNQQKQNMEVHAHHLHKAPGKKIRHYFFEFLMLFLAVFSGFIAENWRESLQEHRREKEYIHSIVQDIKSDTIQSKQILTKLKGISSGIESVLIALSSPEIVHNSNSAYRLWSKILGLDVFVSNDRTIEQLKNSGDLRLIRNKAVSDRIMKYDQTLKKYSVQSDLMYSALRDMTSYSQLFNFIQLAKNSNTPVPLTEEGKKSVNKAYANLQLWNKGLIGLIGWLETIHKEGAELVTFIQTQYGLD
jgi:hypothetical protein